MSRLKKVQETTKKVFKSKQEQKTLIKPRRKLGIGRHKVRIEKAGIVKEKEHLMMLKLESLEDGRKGVFIVPIEGYAMDSLVDIIYDDNDDEVYLEDLEGQNVAVEIVRNKRYLNIDYFEALDLIEEDNQEDKNEEEELDIDIDIDELEFDEEDELDTDYLDDIID